LVSGPALGIYLIAWAIFTGYMMICSLRTYGATAAVFVLLFLTYIALGIGWLAASKSGPSTFWNHLGGYLGILTALAAWYTSFAGVITSVSNGKVALPVYPFTHL